MNKADCLFCRIVAGTAERYLVYEDEMTMAFLDIFPVSHGHLLIVGREHADDIHSMTEEALAAVSVTSLKLARVTREILTPDGIMVAQLNGEAAGQTVFHYHMHLIPRNQGDTMILHSRVPGEARTLKNLADRFQEAVRNLC